MWRRRSWFSLKGKVGIRGSAGEPPNYSSPAPGATGRIRATTQLMFLFGVMMSGVFYSASNGVWPAFFGEMFDTRVRLSGMAIGTQIGFAIAGFMPAVGAAIQGEGPNGWVPVAVLTLIACIIASIAVWTARETYNVPMHDLGRK